jgi:hypothetical protein
MGTPPKSLPVPEAQKAVPVAATKIKKTAAKKINCFVMDKPEKPGLMLVSTDRTQDACFVLGWQPQSVTMLISDAPQWYALAGKILKVDMAFSAVFAFCLLLVLGLNRVVR